jgi:hypothetical protein
MLYDITFGIAIDAAGNTFQVGVAAAVTVSAYSITSGVVFVRKLSPAGTLLWTKAFGAGIFAGNYAVARGVTTDPSGNVIFVGEFNGIINFGASTLTSNATDAFVVKFDTDGNHVWSKSFGDATTSAAQVAYGVATDVTGRVYMAGAFAGSVHFGNGGLVSKGARDAFALCDTAAGVFAWQSVMGDVSDQAAYAITVTPNNVVTVAGEFSGFIGDGTLVGPADSVDAFVMQYDTFGNGLFIKALGGTGEQRVLGITSLMTGATGSLVVVGAFSGSMTLGTTTLVNPAANATNDIFVAKLGSGLDVLEAKRFGDETDATYKDQVAWAVTTDPANHVVVAGQFKGKVNFGGTLLTDADATNATYDVFVAKFATTTGLGHDWSYGFGDSSDQRAFAATTNRTTGQAIIAGGLKGTINFGGTAGSVTAPNSTYTAWQVTLAQ